MGRVNGLIGRRDLLRWGIAAGTTSLAASVLNLLSPEQANSLELKQKPIPISADAALQRLLAGNQRFIKQQPQHPHQSLSRVRSLAENQYPFATILGCADSRIPPEIIFDSGIGDLFTVRVAGNIATDAVIGSLEYSTALLGCQLILVLGHENCGAVKAAIENKPVPGQINYLVESIQPVLDKIDLKTTNYTDTVVIANIQYQVCKLHKCSPTLSQLSNAGKLKIIGARYDLDTGKIEIIT